MYEGEFTNIAFKEKPKKRDPLIDELANIITPEQPKVDFPIPDISLPEINQSEDWLHPESIAIWDEKSKSWKDIHKCKVCGFYSCVCQENSKIPLSQSLKEKISLKLQIFLEKVKLWSDPKYFLEQLQVQQCDLSNESILREHYKKMAKMNYEAFKKFENKFVKLDHKLEKITEPKVTW